MNFFRAFNMAMKSIFTNKMRSFLTMLGIIIGVSSVIILVTLIQGYTQKQMEQWYSMARDTISINVWDEQSDISQDLFEYCMGLSDYITAVTPNSQSWVNNIKYKSKAIEDTTLYFGNEQYSDTMGYKIIAGRDISYSDVKNRIKVVLLGERVRKELFGLESAVGKVMKIMGEDVTVIGVYEAKMNGARWSTDDMMVMPYTLMRTFSQSTTINGYIAKAKDGEATDTAIGLIKTFLAGKFAQEWYYNVYSQNEWQDEMSESTRMMSMVVGGIAGISLMVGGIGIMNIMLVSVTERTREIGIRTAIGARRMDIITQFLIEAATVSAFGGLLGIGVGTIGSILAGAALIKTILIPSPLIMMGAFLFSAILGIFFGFYPANKASKLHPIEALRNQ